jgi:ribose transport system permease protein
MKFLRTRSLGLDRFSGLYLWALFIIVFGIWEPSLFLTAATAHTIASGQAVQAMVAFAALIPLIAGAYDLSVGAVANLAAVIAVELQVQLGWSVGAAVLAAIACGLLVGLGNGFMVVKLRINSFIATLGSGSVVAAIQTIISSNNQPLPPTSTAWSTLTQTTIFGFQIVFLYMLVLALVLWWVLEHTPVGRYLYAIGDNAEASKLSGVRVDRWTWTSLATAGLVSGLAGALYASTVGSPSLTFGTGMLLPAFAAAFLGFTQIEPGRFNIWGSVLAIYVLATGVQGLQFVTSAQWLGDMFNGVALIVAVAFAVWRQQRIPGTQIRSFRRRKFVGRSPDQNDAVQAAEAPEEPAQTRTLDVDLLG